MGNVFGAFFFLATPHGGSGLATLLNNVLGISGVLSAKPYVRDLERNAASARIINDNFRMSVDDDVFLWSFFETIRTNLGVTSSLIVDRESATLGEQYSRVSEEVAKANQVLVMKSFNI